MNIAIVGLGYVGLPLAIELAKHFKITGFDISERRIHELNNNIDRNNETPPGDIKKNKKNIFFTTKEEEIQKNDIIIIAVPTPITKEKTPDLSILESASKIVGQNLKRGAIVVYESTVYPSCTEDFCLPILEKYSQLRLGDFSIGYSPERVNPGDREHTIDKIYKVVAGNDEETTDKLAEVYGKITKIHKASSIKVAEAAKIIENIQRDLNIALMNELALIFQRMGIKTKDVIEAASTKWNFHKYTPGLVGGHCIGVDPYYLTHQAVKLGYKPLVILAGRNINDSMAQKTAETLIVHLAQKGVDLKKSRILVAGATFKENVNDLRNSKIEDVINTLKDNGANVTITDPLFEDGKELFGEINVLEPKGKFDAIFFGSFHDEFKKLNINDFQELLTEGGIIFDLKSNLNPNMFSQTNHTILCL